MAAQRFSARWFRRASVVALGVVLLSSFSFSDAARKLTRQEKKEQNEMIEKVKTYSPPLPNAILQRCEPYRLRAAKVTQRIRLFQIFLQPYRDIEISKYNHCKLSVMKQERAYLEHVNIQQSPSLPKIPMDSPTPDVPKTPDATTP